METSSSTDTSTSTNPLKIFVGNLPFDADRTEIRELFREYGTVVGINVSSFLGRSRYRRSIGTTTHLLASSFTFCRYVQIE